MGDDPRPIVLAALLKAIQAPPKVTELLIPGGADAPLRQDPVGDGAQLATEALLHHLREAVDGGAAQQLVKALKALRRDA